MKNLDKIALMKMGGAILSSTLSLVVQAAKPGVTLESLDKLAFKHIKESGATPAFLGYQPDGASEPYPATLCASVNEVVVHGLPGDYILKDGDTLSIDCGLKFKGFYTDSALTVIIGSGSKEAKHLLATTEAALYLGIQQAKPGHTLGDIGYAIAAYARKNNVSIIEGLTGHGIGSSLHEPPTVFNVGEKGQGQKLESGMTIAIEPMFSLGSPNIKQTDDDAYVTIDGSLSAHFEHTIAITDGEPLILTK